MLPMKPTQHNFKFKLAFGCDGTHYDVDSHVLVHTTPINDKVFVTGTFAHSLTDDKKAAKPKCSFRWNSWCYFFFFSLLFRCCLCTDEECFFIGIVQAIIWGVGENVWIPRRLCNISYISFHYNRNSLIEFDCRCTVTFGAFVWCFCCVICFCWLLLSFLFEMFEQTICHEVFMKYY